MTDLSTSERLPCQVCGRLLTIRRDGLTKPHKTRPRAGDYCQGVGYRQARWEAGQQLRHHSGDVWLVVADAGGRNGDYELRCLAGREKGREMTAHGEYMHRHGWTPITASRFTAEVAYEKAVKWIKTGAPLGGKAK